jgi:hypothetical protein
MMADPPGQVAIAVASVLGRFGVRLAYATESATAAVLVAEIIADADGGLIAIDIETAPTPAEQQRLWAIRLKLADAVGRLKALTRLAARLDPGSARALLLCPGEKPLQRPPALLREGRARVPVFHEAEPLEALKRDPIQVLSVQLAFGEVLQRELFGGAEAAAGVFHRGRSIRRQPGAHCGGVAQRKRLS